MRAGDLRVIAHTCRLLSSDIHWLLIGNIHGRVGDWRKLFSVV